jgi:hypothetical protein
MQEGLPLITNPFKILLNDTDILTRETSESSPFNQSRIEQISVSRLCSTDATRRRNSLAIPSFN